MTRHQLRPEDATWISTGTLSNPVQYIQFIITGTYPPAEGLLAWNDTDGTLNLGMPGGNVALQIGQESLLRCTNKSGGNILNGQAVYIDGAQGSRPTIKLAKADTESTSYSVGLATENINDNNSGYVTTFGLVRDVNTSAFTAGDLLWISATTAGGLTKTRPIAPNHAEKAGVCLFSNASSGIIFIDPDVGFELNELHDVLITGSTSGDVLQYNSSSGTWMNSNSVTILNDAPPTFLLMGG